MVRVFVRGTEAVTAAEVAAQPLHRRGYKQESGPGTLHPPTAAALARLAHPAGTAADPFCGDGTIAIETALSYPAARVLASDINDVRLGHAERNAARAGISLTLRQADAARLPWPDQSIDAVITNPPWNIAVDAGGLLRRSLDGFWRQLPRLLAPDWPAVPDLRRRARRARVSCGRWATSSRWRPRYGWQAGFRTCCYAHRASTARRASPSAWPTGGRRALAAGVITEAGF